MDTRVTPLGELQEKFKSKTALVGVVGLGYVGLPICVAACEVGLNVLGLDVDTAKVDAINRSESYLKHIPASRIGKLVDRGLLSATADFARLSEPDALLICVPTPLTSHLEPDLSFVVSTTEQIARVFGRARSSSWNRPPTRAQRSRCCGQYSRAAASSAIATSTSPIRLSERIPGNPNSRPRASPRSSARTAPKRRMLAAALYDNFVPATIKVSSCATAEAVKLTENIFRAVNIALVNELKIVYGAMGIDIWEVIDAAKTKPFGFMPFYPGPGLGGHCIPIDPFYLTWKAREYGVTTRFIELAGQINTAMPQHVINELARQLDARTGRGLKDARVLVLGVAYKKNVEDIRESPALRLMELLEERGAHVDYYDPYVPVIPDTRHYRDLNGRHSQAWGDFSGYDAILIATDHDVVDYAALAKSAKLIIDTRNACRRAGVTGGNVVGA